MAGEHIVSATVHQNDGNGASVSSDAAGIMLLLGLLLIPASVITAEFPVLRKEPNENLKSIS